MIITTTTMIVLQSLILGGILWTTPKDCPRKYRVIQEEGGVLANPSDIYQYCVLDYGGKWKLKEEYEEK
jgi:hypothetical protein